jgi:hypothetical protein
MMVRPKDGTYYLGEGRERECLVLGGGNGGEGMEGRGREWRGGGREWKGGNGGEGGGRGEGMEGRSEPDPQIWSPVPLWGQRLIAIIEKAVDSGSS